MPCGFQLRIPGLPEPNRQSACKGGFGLPAQSVSFYCAVQVCPYITRLRGPSRRHTVKGDWPNRLGWRAPASTEEVTDSGLTFRRLKQAADFFQSKRYDAAQKYLQGSAQ
ncbi:MAG: hypothetical protein P8X74_14545 [Reinekea sp.]